MSTNNHTPIATGAPANAGTTNGPLGQLDAAIGNKAELTTTAKSNLVEALNEIDATKMDIPAVQTGNKFYGSPDGTSGSAGFRALTGSDLPNSGATPGTYIKVIIDSKGRVVSGETLSASDIAGLMASIALDTLGATTDNTNNDASAAKHGFLPKLANDAMKFINGLGAWVKWACGIKYNGSGVYTPRSFIDFRGAGVVLQDDAANDALRVTISGIAGGAQALTTLTDVLISSPQQYHTLLYDPIAEKWYNANISSIIPTGHVVQNGGSNLTNRPSLNFGGGLTASDNSGSNRTDIIANIATTTAENDFQVGGTGGEAGKWVKKTLAEIKTILGIIAASLTAAGVVELATGDETTTGTDTGRAVTPDGLAGSDYGKRFVSFTLNDISPLTTSDKSYLPIPEEMAGWNLVKVFGACTTPSSSGNVVLTLKKGSTSMLSTDITIEAGEYHSKDATTQPVINTTQDDVDYGNMIEAGVSSSGTGVLNAVVVTVWQKP